MSPRAKVGSLEAVETFRSSLVVYVAQARSALEEVSGEVLRTRVWLESDQKDYWQREMRRRGRVLEEAQQALFSARLSKFSDGVSLEQMAVQRARRGVQEVEMKQRVLKRWTRDFEGTVQPLLKQMEKLHTILSNDMVKAMAELSEVLRKLAEYQAGGAPQTASAGSQPGPTPSPGSESPAANPAAGAETGGTTSGDGRKDG